MTNQKAPEHGGDMQRQIRRFSHVTEPWLDLSTGVNPWSYPLADNPTLDQELPSLDQFQRCRDSMATYFKCSTDRVLPTPGSEIVIRLLNTLIGSSQLVISPPTYGDYEFTWRSHQQSIDFVGDLVNHAKRQKQYSSTQRHTYILCNPNNPDGLVKTNTWIQTLAELVTENSDWLVIDEAYADSIPGCSMTELAARPNTLILRSFGKFFGLPGLRLGAVIAEPAFLEKLSTYFGQWSVSGRALEAGHLAYQDSIWCDQMVTRLENQRQKLDRLITSAGHKSSGNTPLFRLIETRDAAALWHKLMARGIYTRQFQRYPQLLRIGLPRDVSELARLESALTP